MNANIRIARKLIKLAKSLIADDDERFNIVVDMDGNVSDLNDSTFDAIFASTTAALGNRRMSKAVIYVSPDVNATNPPAPGIRGLGTRLHNYMTSLVQRLFHESTIYKSIKKHENKSRYTQEENDKGNYPLGCTIEKGKGVYGAGTGDNMTVENSYIVTIYGITELEAENIAQELKTQFKQESVVIDFTNGNNIDDGNVTNKSEYIF